MKKKTLLKSLLSISIIAMGIFIFFIYTSSIKYSLKQINKAYVNHDITSIEKYIDFNSILDRIFDERLNSSSNEYSSYETDNYNSGRELGEKIGKGIANLMKPQLKERWKQEILSLIEVGEFDSQNDNLQSFSNISRVFLFKKIKSVEKEGKIALIKLEFNLPRYDSIAILNIKMRNKGKYWQVFDVENLFENINLVNELEKKRVSNLNSEMKKEFFKYVKMSNLIVGKSDWNNTYSFYFENQSDKIIDNFDCYFNIVSELDGKISITEYFESFKSKNFLPQQKIKFENTSIAPRFIADNQKFKIVFTSLNFTIKNETSQNWHYSWED